MTRARRQFDERFLAFEHPFDSREGLQVAFDHMFNGVEAILSADRDRYADQLMAGAGRAGQLLGEEYLIPLPDWANSMASYDQRLRVRVIDGDYHPERGLLGVRPVQGTAIYQPGEVL